MRGSLDGLEAKPRAKTTGFLGLCAVQRRGHRPLSPLAARQMRSAFVALRDESTQS